MPLTCHTTHVTGNVLYTGYLYTPCHYIGIEYNTWFARLTCDVIERFDLSSRVRVVEGDVSMGCAACECDVHVM